MNKKIFLCTIIIVIGHILSAQQTTLSNSDAFCYFMKNRNGASADRIDVDDRWRNTWLDLWGYCFDWSNYLHAKNDEFEYPKYLKNNSQVLDKRINSLDFSKTYTYNLPQPLGVGKFDAINGGFGFETYCENTETVYALGRGFCKTYTGLSDSYGLNIMFQFTNASELSKLILKMSEEKAKNFVQSRKTSTGQVNRSVYCKYSFNVEPLSEISGFTVCFQQSIIRCRIVKMDVYANSAMTDLLGSVQFSPKLPQGAPQTANSVTNTVSVHPQNGQEKVWYNSVNHEINDSINATYL